MRCKFAAGGPTVHSVAAVFNPNDALPKALKLVVDGIPVVLCMCKGKHLALKMCNIRLLTTMNTLTALHIVDRVAQPIDGSMDPRTARGFLARVHQADERNNAMARLKSKQRRDRGEPLGSTNLPVT